MAIELGKGKKVNLFKNSVSSEILINLNWTQGIPKKRLFGTITTQSIDLDLGAFVELSDGTKHVVQALGNSFGNLNSIPYVSLDGDDRTGETSGGENLHVNGNMAANINRILIYTFIYEGVANWQQASGIVTIKCSGGDDVIVRMDEYNNSLKMCAIAEIRNTNNGFTVEKLVKFFNGHQDMDKWFGWGFCWTVGRK